MGNCDIRYKIVVMFGLVDCNNFYASCERVFRPNLNGKPVVILSNNDGCVIARSNEAKELGVPMGAPAFKHRDLFESKNITVFSSNYALYGDMSGRIMNILASFAPEIEIYSIDEAFLKFDGHKYLDLAEYGVTIRKYVTRSTGVPVSIGFAETKALAKVANRIAKKYPEQTGGVYTIDTDEKRIKALKWLKVEDVWGIGRKHAKRLNYQGITTAFQFTQQSDSWVKKHMSVVGLRLKRDLEGIPSLDIEPSGIKKSIATTRTFHRNYTNIEDITERVATFSISCAQKLRKQKTNCNTIMVFLHTNGFRNDLPQYSRNIIVKLPFPTNSSIELSKFAMDAIKQIYKPGYEYKKAGVIVMDLSPVNEQQLNLFENSNPKHKPLMAAIDKINSSIGQQKLKFGSQDSGRMWKMKQEQLSPRYTTKLNEIITVNV